MSDAGATRHELAVERLAFRWNDLVMPEGDGDADAEAFPEDGLGVGMLEGLDMARRVNSPVYTATSTTAHS